MLTTDAFNALLKTLEEPPERVVLFLLTDPQKVPTTILSRCQRYDFKRFPAEDIKNHLQFVLSKRRRCARSGYFGDYQNTLMAECAMP